MIENAKRRIAWTRSHQRLLNQLAREFETTKPFAGLTIGVSIHLEPKTAVLLSVLQAGGATVAATGNLGTTQDDIAEAVRETGVHIYGKRSDDRIEHLENVRNVLRHRPRILLDNGADLIALMVSEEEFSTEGVLGGTEETTSGGNRIRHDLAGAVPFPVIVINDSPLKLIVENKHAVGQSVVESFMRFTNLMIPGRRFVVFGYGWCGRGIAKYFKSLGGQVAVVEPDVIRALEAVVDGHLVLKLEPSLSWGSVFVTATGQPNVITGKHFESMPDGAILANAGHFDWEIETDALRSLATKVEEQDEGVEEFTLPRGKRLLLLAGGRMFNLGGRVPKGNSIESMDLGFTLQALSLQWVAKRNAELQEGAQPVPHSINEDAATRLLNLLTANGDRTQ